MTRSDRGSASIWVLACALAVLAAGYVVTVRTAAVLLRHRAQAAADLAALAAAGEFGAGAEQCLSATEFARLNGATVIACHASPNPGGRSGVVMVVVAVPGSVSLIGSVRAVAHAEAERMAVSR